MVASHLTSTIRHTREVSAQNLALNMSRSHGRTSFYGLCLNSFSDCITYDFDSNARRLNEALLTLGNGTFPHELSSCQISFCPYRIADATVASDRQVKSIVFSCGIN